MNAKKSNSEIKAILLLLSLLSGIVFLLSIILQTSFSDKGEFRIPKTKFKADGYDENTKTIYEFHGDYWHGNPKKHDSENPKYFTIVQHDDGPLLDLPPGTIVFGASTGTVPLPLIYEDVSERLLKEPRIKKDVLASFVGSMTHPIRDAMIKAVDGKDGIVCQGKNGWNAHISDDLADVFIKLTLRSKFCLAPRGYGRSSFRFFEAMQLDTIPVYIWDDICWLPYQDVIDYSTFSVLIHKDDIHKTYEILSSISDGKYEEMQCVLREVRHKFTLEWMCNYIHHFL